MEEIKGTSNNNKNYCGMEGLSYELRGVVWIYVQSMISR